MKKLDYNDCEYYYECYHCKGEAFRLTEMPNIGDEVCASMARSKKQEIMDGDWIRCDECDSHIYFSDVLPVEFIKKRGVDMKDLEWKRCKNFTLPEEKGCIVRYIEESERRYGKIIETAKKIGMIKERD